MFDKAPVIVHPWSVDLDVKRMDVSRVPIRVGLIDLDLKYWGQQTLMKLDGQLGKPIKTDRATAMKELLSYARVPVEMSIELELPKVISFENEWGYICHIALKYEWEPIKCKKCSMFRHEEAECKKGMPKPQWMKKNTGGQGTNVQHQQQGEHRAGKEVAVEVPTQNNSFEMLGEVEMDKQAHDLGPEGCLTVYEIGTISAGSGNDTMDMQNAAGGGIPPRPNG